MKVRVWTGAPGGFLAQVRIFLCSTAKSPDLRQYPMYVDIPGATEADLEKMRNWASKVEKISD